MMMMMTCSRLGLMTAAGALRMQGRMDMSSQVKGPQNSPGEAVISAVEHDKFRLKMAIKNYSPEEVKVKVVDGYLVVEGKHEESGPQGRTTKEFTKWLRMPEDVDPATVEHSVSTDGILSLTALKKSSNSPTVRSPPP